MFKVLVSDAAAAIKNSFIEVLRDHKIIQCYLTLNIKKNDKIKSRDNKARILQDLGKLQLAASKDIFDVVSNLFLKKWQTIEPDFVSYFNSQ